MVSSSSPSEFKSSRPTLTTRGKLGGKAWKNLHRLAYLAAALAAYHQAAARKIFPMQVVWIFGPLVVLEIARIWKQRMKPKVI